MKKVLGLFILVLLVTGCTNKFKEEIDVELSTGTMTSICTKKEVKDNVTVTTITTSNYDSNKDIINMKIEATFKFKDVDTLNTYIADSKKAKDSISEDTIGDTIFNYTFDEKGKKLYTILVYNKFSLIDEVKPQYKIDKHIKTLEDNGEKCKLIGITREELGLSK